MNNIIKVQGVDAVHELIASNIDSFPHLMEKIDNLLQYANKIARYGEVYAYKSETSDEMVGFIAFYANDRISQRGYITLLGVKPEIRKRGVGGTLIDYAEQCMMANGMTTIGLEVDSDNMNAIRFYTHKGFRQAGGGTESLQMEKKITRGDNND